MQSTEEVQEEVQKFIDAAERYYKAGFDGIELNASCNHYFSTFLSRRTNCERTDQYSGKTIENRCRILTEIIEGIRERLGNDFIIQVLYSGVEGNVAELYCLAQKSGCCLIFLPPYSPELNPIEHFWAGLKRTLRRILPKLDSLDQAIFAAFYFREQPSSV